MGILDAIAGGLKGGAEATGQVADKQLAVANQAYLNQNLSDIHVQEQGKIAEHQAAMGVQAAANERARLAGAAYKTPEEAMAGGEPGMAASLATVGREQAQTSESVARAEKEKRQAKYIPTYQGIFNVEKGEMEPNTARTGKTLDPSVIAENQYKSDLFKDKILNDRASGIAFGMDPITQKPMPDAPVINGVKRIADTLMSQNADASGYTNPTPHVNMAVQAMSKMAADAEAVVKAKFPKVDIENDPQARAERARLINGQVNAWTRAHMGGGSSAPAPMPGPPSPGAVNASVGGGQGLVNEAAGVPDTRTPQEIYYEKWLKRTQPSAPSGPAPEIPISESMGTD